MSADREWLKALRASDFAKLERLIDKYGVNFTLDTPEMTETPVLMVALDHSAALARWLIERGADVTRPGGDLSLPLNFAASYAPLYDLIDLLLEKGAALEGRSGDGYTPLHEAIISGNPRTVALLLARGADPKAVVKPLYPSHDAPVSACDALELCKRQLRRRTPPPTDAHREVRALLEAALGVQPPKGGFTKKSR